MNALCALHKLRDYPILAAILNNFIAARTEMKLLQLIRTLFLINISCFSLNVAASFDTDAEAIITSHYPRCALTNLQKIADFAQTHPLALQEALLAGAQATKARVVLFQELLSHEDTREYLRQGKSNELRIHERVRRLLPSVMQTERDLVTKLACIIVNANLDYVDQHYIEKTRTVLYAQEDAWFDWQVKNYAGRIKDFEEPLSFWYRTLIMQFSAEDIASTIIQRLQSSNQKFSQAQHLMALGLFLELCDRLEPDVTRE